MHVVMKHAAMCGLLQRQRRSVHRNDGQVPTIAAAVSKQAGSRDAGMCVQVRQRPGSSKGKPSDFIELPSQSGRAAAAPPRPRGRGGERVGGEVGGYEGRREGSSRCGGDEVGR